MANPHAIVAKAFAEGQPRIGFGTGNLFLDGRSGDAVRLIDTAYEAGFRYFDTARLYGDGQSERVIGAALSRYRDKIVLTSKAGIVPWSMQIGRRITAKAATLVGLPGNASAREGAFSAKEITNSVETSLKALRTDYLDLLLLHECTLADTTSIDTLRVLERLLSAGKIRGHGIATRPDRTLAILADGRASPAIVQAPADIVGKQLRDYGRADGRLLITHSAIRPVLDALRSDRELASRLRSVGIDPDDTSSLVAHLTAHALATNPDGIVLASTLKPERAATLFSAAARPKSGQLEQLEAALSGA